MARAGDARQRCDLPSVAVDPHLLRFEPRTRHV